MTVLLYVLLVVVLVVVALAIFISTRPDSFRLQRSILVNAPPEAIAPHVADFHKWRGWSPFENLDVDLKRDYSGAASGVGAVYAWEGKKAGAGRMEITEASTRRVLVQLDFLKPMVAHNLADFTFEPQGQATKVSWAMSGKCNFMGKAFSLLCNMDKMVGGEFQKGLVSLKSVAETGK